MLCVLFANNYEQDVHINDVISSEHDEKSMLASVRGRWHQFSSPPFKVELLCA